MADIFGASSGTPAVLRRKRKPKSAVVAPAKPPAFVNTAKANPRIGQRFDVVNKGGVRYHRYQNGLLIADKVKGTATSTPEEATAKGVTPTTPAPPTPKSPPAPPSASATPSVQVNTVKGNPRFGQSYKTVEKGGRTFHRYKDGQMIAMDKGAPERPRPPRGAPPPRFTTRKAAEAWDRRHPNASDRAAPRGRRWGGRLNLSRRRKAIARPS